MGTLKIHNNSKYKIKLKEMITKHNMNTQKKKMLVLTIRCSTIYLSVAYCVYFILMHLRRYNI